ncbi:MAG TPA: DUF6356 family protein [Caulobacteraceae bacterium]|jgi:hypothetical protein
MLNRLFLDHPRSMGESYFEHQRVAFSFALRLFVASLACALHALIPGLCVSTGSRAVADLNDRLVVGRRRTPAFEDRAFPA